MKVVNEDYMCRRARSADIDDIILVIEDARRYLGSRGVDQWQDGFPDRKAITCDVNSEISYVITHRGKIAGTFALSPDDEPSYSEIIGNGWLNPAGNYATIHRVAVSSEYRGRGLSELIFGTCTKEAADLKMHSIRIDTHKDNDVMKHIILRNGFTYCGIIRLSRDNAERSAYEKLLT